MFYLGIDIGSLFVGTVLLDEKQEILKSDYQRHQGEPVATLQKILTGYPLQSVLNVVRTGSGGNGVDMIGGDYIDPVVAGVEGVKALVPDARNIIQIGGGSFSLTRLADDGSYQRSSINSACASGTGAFLDQQSLRLQVPPTELADRAMSYDKKPPAVATRCAVFAKSDMIHLQQEGFTVDAIAAGLCVGLGNSTVDGLLSGRALVGKTAIIGGVAINSVVAGSVRDKLGVEVVVPENPNLVGAFGAATVALRRYQQFPDTIQYDFLPLFDYKGESGGDATARDDLRPPLELKLSNYPDFKWHKHWVNEDGSEIAIVDSRQGRVTVTFGVDIGSTSTKAVFLDPERKVVGWIYRKTAGNPIRAVQLLMKAAREMEKEGGFSFDVKGVGTTGSGRRMIGALIGADLATNEITAHASAAVFIDPQVDTIIELGGQDAKFTQLQNGMVYNSIMNYVCAAGTGSFIEEQSLKLGIPLGEYADRAMGKPCPLTSDRCTVYMERDLDLLLAKGWNKDQVAAAVLHSVRDNYLNKVVGGLYIGDHVYFQGATARNRALVAAFEVELGKEIKVSPYCHLTGALGMCILVDERIPADKRSEKFKGLGFADAKVDVDYEVCTLCHNNCNLSLIKTDEGTLAWGLKCGRDYGEKKVKVRDNPTFEWWRKRYNSWLSLDGPKVATGRGRIGILQSLGTYGYYPFWKKFVETLGFTPVLSSRTGDRTMHDGTSITSAEYCAPVVASHGHAMEMLSGDKVDWLLVPYMMREPTHEGFTDAHFCCYVQAHPGVLMSAAGLNGKDKILSPIFLYNRPDREVARSLAQGLAKVGVSEAEALKALQAAREAQKAFAQKSLALGAEAMQWLEEKESLGLVCIGRPYNTLDAGLTLDLPRKMAALGYPVFYLDMLPYDLNSILPEFSNMYWHYGQKILATAQYVAQHPRLFGVYFTNFMCGPDSYVMTYFKEIMNRVGKPYLCLQFDGHGADAGYLTRVEAALESFHTWSKIARPEVVEVAD